MSTELTTTSYAILGLLAIRPWSTYELAQQMDRSLGSFWPRAASRIYEEPKRLVEQGLAKASRGAVGRRPRTVYRITAKGRRTLRAWLAVPGQGPMLEFDGLLRLFFAEHGTRDEALATIAAIRAWATARDAVNVEFARLYRDGVGAFPDRAAPIVLTGRFLTDFADMVGAWADWATRVVAAWPDDISTAEPDWQTLDEVAGRRLGR
jgi:DNA-binding PadR family transcriptional regulator